ncbi:hypothetical protein COU54_00695 [Candidatus Pacearchaeota archaeon CG10_big_fil_rev_8_21_14_0_10_31_24]|nr:MAG: hypothetical protein COU54_00695 [Candidatus Pacearchaeota archaeon CG10_big_fil_rev_8_21_14_0_10_31_24]
MERHKNILYGMVFLLLILQIFSFISLTSQVTNANVEITRLTGENEKLKADLGNVSVFFSDLLISYQGENQKSFQDISQSINSLSTTVSVQQTELNKELKSIKSSQGDFSNVIDDAVKSVVTVRTDRSIGTGFVVDDRGFIVTNNHVIDGANQIVVLTYDKKILPATLIGTNVFKDVALLRIEGNYPALAIADSDTLKVGNKVIAIGNPLGLSFTVTEGIISALNRAGPTQIEEYIQTDVSLNPGNSGGPLIDTSGNVIGINNFKVGEAESLGFALESNSFVETLNTMTNNTLQFKYGS